MSAGAGANRRHVVLWVVVFILLVFGGTRRVAAQQPMRAVEAMKLLDAMRDRAEPLWKAGNARGLAIMDSADAFVTQPAVADLARGSSALYGRLPSFLVELACAQAIVGHDRVALRSLGRAYESVAPPSIETSIRTDCPALYALRNAPEYRKLHELWRSEILRWTDRALTVPYRDTLSVDERIASLSMLWSNVKHTLPGFQTVPGLDLDSLYLAFLPQVRPVQSTLDYYRTLERFAAALKDGHTNVYLPDTLESLYGAAPPLRMLPVEGQAVVTWVLAPELDAMGIRRGRWYGRLMAFRRSDTRSSEWHRT